MIKNYTYGVITKVPSHKKGGNLFSSLMVSEEKQEDGFESYRELDDDDEDIESKDVNFIWAKRPVFELGEILILDGEYGREVSGRGRKPFKWSVECKYFSDLERAVECANSL